MSDSFKGDLLEVGLQGKMYETKSRIRIMYVKYSIIILICFVLAGLSLRGNVTLGGSNYMAFSILFIIGIICILIILFMNGAEIDGIYENGLTHRRVGLIKKWQGKHWIPWNEVDTINYGKFDLEDERGISEYVRIYSGEKDSWFFIKAIYDAKSPSFYPLLIQMLKEKSPQAQWVEKEE